MHCRQLLYLAQGCCEMSENSIKKATCATVNALLGRVMLLLWLSKPAVGMHSYAQSFKRIDALSTCRARGKKEGP